MKSEKYSFLIDNVIIFLLITQIITVNISIAVSSIAFGIWITLWLIQIIMNGKINYDKNLFHEIKIINIFIVLYFIFEIISRFFALYPDGAFNNLKRLLLFLIFYVSIIKIVNIQVLSKLLFINICAVSLISIIELIQYSVKFGNLINQMPFSEIRIDYFSYPLTSGEIKMMSFFSIFPIMVSKEKFIIAKKYFILILIPVFISMILTQSRNVLLAVLICFVVYGTISNKKFLLALLAVLLISWIILPPNFTDRATSIIDLKHPSNEIRLTMWNVGFQMFKDHPFTGVADSHIKETYETYKIADRHGEGVHLHNNFIMILATTGIFGFISFLGMFLSIFFKQVKFYKEEKNELPKLLVLGSILVMISFQISGIFEWSFGDHEVMTVFFFLVSVPFVVYKFRLIKS